jgi:hypothetical protein
MQGGTAVAQWLRRCATNRKVAGSIPDGVTGIFHWHKILRSRYGPGVDSASNRNEYQEYFLGGGGKKRSVRKADNLTTILGHCHVIWEPYLPGTLWAPRACNGTDLPFTVQGKKVAH